MTGSHTLAEFYLALARFVEGTSGAPWKTVAQYLNGPSPRAIGLHNDELEIAEACWELLCDSQFDHGIVSFYNPGGWRDEYDPLAERLARNAKGLFATALVAATLRHFGSCTETIKWINRAI